MTELREGKWDWRGMWNARREICLKEKICSKILKGKDKFGEPSVDGGNINLQKPNDIYIYICLPQR